jgi:Ca2+-binding EF-hand superfamily protein
MTNNLIPTAIASALTILASTAVAHPDANHTGGGQKPSIKQVVRAMDTDGDGLVSFEEFELPEKRRGADRLEAADTDGDGNISRAEMEAQLAEHVAADTERAEKRFEQADINGDGFITPEERKQVAFEMLDENQDGYLSAEELAKARKRQSPPQG